MIVLKRTIRNEITGGVLRRSHTIEGAAAIIEGVAVGLRALLLEISA